MTSTPEPLCAHEGYDPEWWVHDHLGQCTASCPHRLASHICQQHCQLTEQCQSEVMQYPEDWVGSVVGGLMSHKWRVEKRQYAFEVRPVEEAPSCSMCPSRVALTR